MKKCDRTACTVDLERMRNPADKRPKEWIRIWNRGEHNPRDYCAKCARGILEYAKQIKTPLKNVLVTDGVEGQPWVLFD